jgi:hypothetical protein
MAHVMGAVFSFNLRFLFIVGVRLCAKERPDLTSLEGWHLQFAQLRTSLVCAVLPQLELHWFAYNP